MNTIKKLDYVKELLKDKKVAIAFSGGADSTLIGKLAKEVSKEVLAITIDNNLMPINFLNDCKKIAKELNINQVIIKEDFYKNKEFIENKSNRCYLCREQMYLKITEIANSFGFSTIVDGTNISDLLEDRPGILIVYKNNILSPFIDCKLESFEIHKYLNDNNIDYLKASTCIATRIPTNTSLKKEEISKIQSAEDFIAAISKCEIVKVRKNNNDALCEVDEINYLLNKDILNRITDELKSLGFKNVYLNLRENQNEGSLKLECFPENNKFSFNYQLPYEINILKTSNKLNIDCNNEKIKLNNVIINKNGNIEGKNFESEKKAKKEFLNVLPFLIREI